VTSPTVLKEVKPNYTGEAMRARIQGTVTMEAVVMPDGSVGNVHITRSLDSAFGLDNEAIKTVKQWRFRPGTRLGQPVPVLIVIEMSFTLR
jgi:protein TonB